MSSREDAGSDLGAAERVIPAAADPANKSAPTTRSPRDQKKPAKAAPAPPRRKAGRSARARSLRMTREGKWFVGITLGVGFAAVNTGNNLIYLMLGLMLSLIIVSGVLSELTLRRVKVRRQLPARAFADQETLVEIVLTNQKRFVPSLSLEVEDIAKGVVTERRCYFLKVAPGGTQVAAYRRRPRRRGLLELTSFRLATRYPFGLFEKSRHVESSSELVIFPALVPTVPMPVPGPVLDDAGHDVTFGQGAGIAGLREHRVGDDARDVHWPKSTALGRWVVRERERDARHRVLLRLDRAKPAGLDEIGERAWAAGFEHAVSTTASTAAMLLRRGIGVGVVTRGASSPMLPPSTAPDPLWRFLALLEPIDASSAPPMPKAQGHVIDIPVIAREPAPPADATSPPPVDAEPHKPLPASAPTSPGAAS
ncbi:MAG: DUF58 domain-containing protein [Deltaproteobacteria bacterium]|nr:DUF58 domain-containing protein [Deltaproteobacteria bacterium]